MKQTQLKQKLNNPFYRWIEKENKIFKLEEYEKKVSGKDDGFYTLPIC